MKKINSLICSILLCSVVNADGFKPNYNFSNVSVNYLNWTDNTERKSPQKDFAYLELEGGAGWDWGEFYAFVDMENPTKGYSDEEPDNMRFALKPIFDIKIIDKLSLHIQDYHLQSDEFYVNNLIVGLSYKIETDFGLWIRPFIAPHYQTSTYYSGMNGYMLGWVFDYQFDIQKHKFSLSQWHQNTFERDEEDGYNDHVGTQGALSFWWHPVDKITTGVQYRYASYELGSSEYQDGFIYSLKYNF